MDNFIYGVATAAYQNEGAYLEDGKSLSIWDTFASNPDVIKDHKNANISCDHYHRYLEDVEMMADLKINTYRFSISWSRVIKDGNGEVNLAGIKFYENLIKALIAKNIKPFITLYHFDLPQHLQDLGGFLNPEFVNWFKYYTEVVIKYFGPYLDHVVTFNEPENSIYCGLLEGSHAPGLKLKEEEVLCGIHHILLAHGEAVRLLKKYNENIKVGFVACGWVPTPVESSDIELARKIYFSTDFNRLSDGVVCWLDPICKGTYPSDYLEKYGHLLNFIKEDDMQIISTPIDFIGLNLYSGYFVSEKGLTKTVDQTDIGWLIIPEVVYYGPKFIYERYQKPIIICENGTCDNSEVVNEVVDDKMRIENLHSYLKQLRKAYDEGVDIKGYIHWTFTDNFEWAMGYSTRFGLVHIDFDTLKRTKKASFEAYRKIIEEHTYF